MSSTTSKRFGKSSLNGQITDTVQPARGRAGAPGAPRKIVLERADPRHRPAGAMQGLGLLPNPSVEGNRQVFDHDDAGTGLARGRHWRPSIVRIRGFR